MTNKTQTGSNINTREIVLQILSEVLEKGGYSHLIIKAALDKYAYLEKNDRAFIKRLSEGTIEQKIRLDYIIDSFSKTKTAKMKPLIREILRMGTYQICFMEKIPDSAACNEAVKLAVKHGFSSLKGFVNGVLRSIARGKEHIGYPDPEKETARFDSVYYSMPQWIVSRWLKAYGEKQTEQILQGLLQTRPVTIRRNTTQEEWNCLVEKWKECGIQVHRSELYADAYEVSGFDRIETMSGYQNGRFMIQDTGSMLITDFARIRPGDRVIDVCAAPGGKALHAAFLTGENGQVEARDLTEYKTSLIEENLARSGFGNVAIKVWDATQEDADSIEKADVVIADLPCSGLGAIARKGDIKYRLKEEDIEQIASLQRKILSVVQTYVKPGGILLYSTCTLTTEENEANTEWFLQNFPFQIEEEQTLFPGNSRNGETTDGFYMARLRKGLSGQPGAE